MPTILDKPPIPVFKNLSELKEQLDEQIPPKKLDKNLLVGTWNIRAFGGLTEKWISSRRDSPQRDLHSLLCIAEIISRFDVIALQEVKSDLKALRHALKYLGSHWGLVLTDVTKGAPGNGERMAYLFDTRKVQMSGLATELVVPEEQLSNMSADALEKQFARTPYAVSFRCGSATFILITLHVLYGKRPYDRVGELKAIAEWMADWAKDINAWDHNLIALGDFNIDRIDDQLYKAFTSTGLTVPKALHQVPRSIFHRPGKGPKDKFYDQIAWFTEKGDVPALSLKYNGGGSFDFTRTALSNRSLTRNQVSWRISDHYPLWVEFLT
ncbi:MAG: endonuclease/exonuclease/phosphatase family protein [Calditrichia bacterium]